MPNPPFQKSRTHIDYSLLPRFDSESHPLVHDYKGELCAGANGFVEIHEILNRTRSISPMSRRTASSS